MRKLLLLLAVPLALSACDTTGSGGINSPAPLAQTTIDSTTLIAADKAFDLALDSINLAVDLRVRIPGRADDAQPFIPGTTAAKNLASLIRTVDAALNAATRFAAAGETSSYATALAEAQAGVDQIRLVIKR